MRLPVGSAHVFAMSSLAVRMRRRLGSSGSFHSEIIYSWRRLVFDECCPVGRSSSLSLLVFVFVSGVVSLSHVP